MERVVTFDGGGGHVKALLGDCLQRVSHVPSLPAPGTLWLTELKNYTHEMEEHPPRETIDEILAFLRAPALRALPRPTRRIINACYFDLIKVSRVYLDDYPDIKVPRRRVLTELFRSDRPPMRPPHQLVAQWPDEFVAQWPDEFVVLVGDEVILHTASEAEASAAYDAAFDSHPGEQPLFLRPGEREQRWEEPVLRGRTMVDAAWEVPAERVLERFLLRLPPELDTEWAESSLRFFAEEVRVLKEGLIWVRALPEGMVRRLQERGIIVEMA